MKRAIVICAAVYLLGIGFLLGIATERIYFDQQRAAMMGQYETVLRRWQGYLMQLEKNAGAPDSGSRAGPR